MLDVHPPHHAATTWREVFVHIGIIVVGLLIAIGLEKTVEFFHDRHEANHARELLAEEMSANRELVRRERYILAMHENYLFADLAVIDRMRRHALLPNDHLVLFHPDIMLSSSAWETAQQSQLLALLPYDEVHSDARVYHFQDEYTQTMVTSVTALQYANTMRYHSTADRFDSARANRVAPAGAFYGKLGDAAAHAAFEDQSISSDTLAHFTPAQIDRLEQTVQQAIYGDERLINRCDWLEAAYQERLGE